ncbi:MAG: 3-hydroxyacyl-CoA dehydrogenase family protein [Promethearchaeota archaeon]
MRKSKDIKKISVIGAGVIGNSWTTNFIWRGFPVNLWCYTEGEKTTAKQIIQDQLNTLVLNGVLEKEKIAKIMNLVNFTTSLEEAVKNVEFIQESVLENLELKQKLLANIDKFANPESIFASSTSSLKISDIARNSQYSKRCINAHPYNPPHLLPLVEITIPEGETKGSKQTAEVAAEFYRSIKKVPIILKKDYPRFIGNQIQSAVMAKNSELLQEGVCSIEDLNKAITFGPGMRWGIMGPYLIYQLGNLGGIKGLMMHILPEELRNADKKALKEHERVADFVQSEVNKEMLNRSPEFGNDNESLRKFRDKMLIEMLKIHKKI